MLASFDAFVDDFIVNVGDVHACDEIDVVEILENSLDDVELDVCAGMANVC